MSVTRDFEERAWKSEHNGIIGWYDIDEVQLLLAHARALETFLKKIEWDTSEKQHTCSWCGQPKKEHKPNMGHAEDCQLAKLLEGIK